MVGHVNKLRAKEAFILKDVELNDEVEIEKLEIWNNFQKT